MRYSLRPINHLYGQTPAAAFGPLALKAVRELMVHGYEHPKYGPQEALCRGVINRRVGRIVRLFRWAEELVRPEVSHGLKAVRGLKKGRCDARETPPVQPVDSADVEVVLPHLPLRSPTLKQGPPCESRDVGDNGSCRQYRSVWIGADRLC